MNPVWILPPREKAECERLFARFTEFYVDRYDPKTAETTATIPGVIAGMYLPYDGSEAEIFTLPPKVMEMLFHPDFKELVGPLTEKMLTVPMKWREQAGDDSLLVPDFVVCISECWLSTRKKDDELIQPSQDPERKQGIMMLVSSLQGTNMLRIEIDAGKLIGEPVWQNEPNEGRMVADLSSPLIPKENLQ